MRLYLRSIVNALSRGRMLRRCASRTLTLTCVGRYSARDPLGVGGGGSKEGRGEGEEMRADDAEGVLLPLYLNRALTEP